MNYKTAAISTLCLFSLVFVIACEAQNDSLKTDEVLITELMNDPLTDQFISVQKNQKNLIAFSVLDIEGLGDVLKKTPGNDPCNVTADLSHLEHAVEYFDNMCRHIRLMTAIKEKYPEVKELDSDIKTKIFFPTEPVTVDELLLILEKHNSID